MLQFSSLLHVIAFVYDFWYVFYVYKIAVLTDASYCVHPSATYNCCDSSLCPDHSFVCISAQIPLDLSWSKPVENWVFNLVLDRF